MFAKLTVLFIVVFWHLSALHLTGQSLTRIQACEKLRSAAVRIDVSSRNGKSGSGTGFIVSLDGWVVTAAHVVIDNETRDYYPHIDVSTDLGNVGRKAAPIPLKDILRDFVVIPDFAILKVKDLPKGRLFHLKTELAPLPLAEEAQVPIGSEVALFGNPSAAGFPDELCLFGTVAAIYQPEIFYQGVAVGGMSGGPMLSLDSGKVIGIIKRRTADIPALERVGNQFASESTDAKALGDKDTVTRKAVSGIFSILDTQFNNGLGAATNAYYARTGIREGATSTGEAGSLGFPARYEWF